MLFVCLMTPKAGTQQERVAKRVTWKPPEGLRPVAEYWLQASDPAVISIAEADNVGAIMAGLAPWLDYFNVTVVPAVTAEEGLKLVQQG